MLKYKAYVPEENPLEDFDSDFKQGKYKKVRPHCPMLYQILGILETTVDEIFLLASQNSHRRKSHYDEDITGMSETLIGKAHSLPLAV